MDIKKYKGVDYFLYEDIAEFSAFNPNGAVEKNWRMGEKGEYVFTDDGCVCKVIKKHIIGKKNCVMTVMGTFCIDEGREMLGDEDIPSDITRFGRSKGTTLSAKEKLFARYVAEGVNAIEAFKTAFPDANSESYIKNKTKSLLKTNKVDKMISEEKKAMLDSIGASPEIICKAFLDKVNSGDSDSTQLRALENLAKISGLYEQTEKKSETLEVWAGFSPEQLEAVDNGEKKLLGTKTKLRG